MNTENVSIVRKIYPSPIPITRAPFFIMTMSTPKKLSRLHIQKNGLLRSLNTTELIRDVQMGAVARIKAAVTGDAVVKLA